MLSFFGLLMSINIKLTGWKGLALVYIVEGHTCMVGIWDLELSSPRFVLAWFLSKMTNGICVIHF